MELLDALFSPRAVAVVGAGRSPQSIGYQLVNNLLEFGYRGSIYPVNPKADEILGQACYPSIEALPTPVDLAVLALPARLILDTVRACHAKGIRGIVTITAGFRESGEAGAELEGELRRTLRELGVKMVGPNCMGLLNTDDEVRLNATFAFTQPLPGNVAFASQSGSLGEAILSHARSMGLGLSEFVSLGNSTDLTSEDMVARWAADPRTGVILLYLETLADAHSFLQQALSATRGSRTPILAVKSGRTDAGARAASSHTGALAGRDQLTNALFERCGIVRVDRIHDLFTVAKAFSSQPLPRGSRLAILTNAGGPAIQAADATAGTGITVADLDETTQAALEEALPPGASWSNPVDMLATAQGETFGRCAEALLSDPGVDALLLIYVTPIILDTPDVARKIVAGLGRGREAADRPKPVLTCVMGKAHEDPGAEVLMKAGFPVYPFPELAIQALAAMNDYARWLDEPEGEVPYYADVDPERVWSLLQDRPEGWLDTDTAAQVLRAYGIPIVPSRKVDNADAAIAAAKQFGGPVALKVDSDAIVHKTDVGGVALDLRTPDEIRAAIQTMEESLGPDAPPHAFRVQQMVHGGHETIVGVTLDPIFGHVVMFGLGGIAVEVLGDVRFEMLPMTSTKARQMIRGIRGVKLLDGYRGRPPVDHDLLQDVIVRVGRLVADHPRIHELDLNPLMAHEDADRAGVVDLRIRLGPSA
jgi:acetate---CoA ligase (ADP-forming)